MGEAGEAQNITHQQKKMGTTSLKAFRDRFGLPIPDDKIDEVPYLKFDKDSPEFIYMQQRRQALGGFLHRRQRKAEALQIPPLSAFDSIAQGKRRGKGIFHYHGVCAHPQYPRKGQEYRQTCRTDRCG